MKHIIFTTGAMGRGGAERVISILSEYYIQKGWRVTIFLLLHSHVHYQLHSKINIIDISNDKKSPVYEIPRLVSSLRSYIAKEKPDAVISFMAPICLVTALSCIGQKVKFIPSERNDPEKTKRNFVVRYVLDYIYSHSFCTIFQTKRAQTFFSYKTISNSCIIPNPIRVTSVTTNQKNKRIVAVGRLEHQKNHSMLISAFATFYQQHPDYILDIFGEGTLRPQLQEQINKLSLEAAITLKGSVANIHEQIADAELFVLPSNFEGLSNALLEAMMMGLACISTDCAGSDEVIEDSVNGLLVPVGDAKSLINAIEKLAFNVDLREKLAKNAKISAEVFSVEKVVKQWERVIEQ